MEPESSKIGKNVPRKISYEIAWDRLSKASRKKYKKSVKYFNKTQKPHKHHKNRYNSPFVNANRSEISHSIKSLLIIDNRLACSAHSSRLKKFLRRKISKKSQKLHKKYICFV